MMNSTIIINGCSDCPLCKKNDMGSGYYCQLKEHPDNYIPESKVFQPITPDWCHVKENNVVLKFKS